MALEGRNTSGDKLFAKPKPCIAASCTCAACLQMYTTKWCSDEDVALEFTAYGVG